MSILKIRKCLTLTIALQVLSFVTLSLILHYLLKDSKSDSSIEELNSIINNKYHYPHRPSLQIPSKYNHKTTSAAPPKDYEKQLDAFYNITFNELLKERRKEEVPYNPPEYAKYVNDDDGVSSYVKLTEDEKSQKYNKRENATFVTLVRNSELKGMIDSIRIIEDRFNSKFHYDWVFLNDEPFTSEFKMYVTNMCSGNVKFGLLNTSIDEEWGMPSWIDKELAQTKITEMKIKEIPYGGSISYRNMCRFQSGFFFKNELLKNYKYYWRVEPDIKIYCDINYDIFKFMNENKKKYGFTISIVDFPSTIPTLWDTTKKFLKEFYPNILNSNINSNNLLDFISNDKGKSYNFCHFWSNFEVGDLDFWRSKEYTDYFNYLDKSGGFYYERWGDAPVHSIGAALFLKPEEFHFFDDFGYFHAPSKTCPKDPAVRLANRCICDGSDKDITYNRWSCVPRYLKINKYKMPTPRW